MLLLTVGTYWLLMRCTATLSNEIILPAKFLEDNIAAILSITWPKSYLGPPGDAFPRQTSHGLDLVTFYAPTTFLVESEGRLPGARTYHKVLGFAEIEDVAPCGFPDTSEPSGQESHVTMKVFSPVVKGLVQIAVWNSVSFWLVITMFVNTIVYNGFVTRNVTSDSIVRLFLVGVYAAANIGHQFRTTKLLYNSFTLMVFQTCWTIICKKFLFFQNRDFSIIAKMDPQDPLLLAGDPEYYIGLRLATAVDAIWTRLSLELFGTTERSEIYQLLLLDECEPNSQGTDKEKTLATLSPPDNDGWWSHLKAGVITSSMFDRFVKPLRDAELKAYEKATESALEKTLANVAVLLGICLATALAPWTSVQTFNATNTQLGSYALLASISTGLVAIVGGLTQLTNATDSAKSLLLFQEKTIDAKPTAHQSHNVLRDFSMREIPPLSFSAGLAGASKLSSVRHCAAIWQSMGFLNVLSCFILGPALTLIPDLHSGCLGHYISFTIQNVELFCSVSGPSFGDMYRRQPERRPAPNTVLAHEQENAQAAKTETTETAETAEKGDPQPPILETGGTSDSPGKEDA